MSHVDVLTPAMENLWDEFVESHKFGQLYHTTAWKDVLETSFPHITNKNLVLWDDKSIKIVGALPLYLVKSWLLGNRLICIPQGTLCDPLVGSRENFRILFDYALTLKQKYKCTRIELKIFESMSLISEMLIPYSVHKHHYLNLMDDFDKLSRNFKRTVRQSVRKAMESDLEVIHGKSIDDLKEVYNLYLKTRKRNLVPSQPYSFFENIWNKLYPKNMMTLLMVKRGELTIGGGIVIRFKNRATLEFLASDENSFSLRPNHLLVWNAIKNAIEDGCHVFDFGRTAPDDTGLMRFKQSWGSDVVDLVGVSDGNAIEKIADKTSLKWKMIRFAVGRSPLPIYRILNTFCYRHHG